MKPIFDSVLSGDARRARQLRLDTLIRSRWLAVAGQTAAVLVTAYGFGFALPLALCMGVIAASAWLNIGLRIIFPINYRLPDRPAALLLAYDLAQLSLLLYLTGGLLNPFAVLFLAPVTVSALSLPPRRTIALVALMAIMSAILAFWRLPLPWFPDRPFDLPFLYVCGIWLAIALGAAFIAFYVSRVASEGRSLADALAATELVLAREQHLSQLDGLAAAAAHELGTPLATITLVVKDLEKEFAQGAVTNAAKNPALAEDVQLLAQEVARCRVILRKIATLGDESGGHWGELSLSGLLGEAAEPSRDFGVLVDVEPSGEGPEPRCRRNPGLLYGIGNLIENAVDFARERVRVEATWTSETVRVVIQDDGPGFAPDVLGRLGEPYVTTRGPARKSKSEEGAGMGLGLFVAKTLLERSGAAMTMGNAELPGVGARIVISWPRKAFESGIENAATGSQPPAGDVKARQG